MTKILSCAAVLGLLVASSSGAFAKGPGALVSGASPGGQFVSNGRQPTGTTPGASGYSPGQNYIGADKAAKGSPGASGYAPGTAYAPGFLK
jgi:hypothetical protein